MSIDSFPIALARVLSSATYNVVTEILKEKADRLMGNDPELSPIKANHDAAAIILAEYRLELARLDKALTTVAQRNAAYDLVALSEKLRTLDVHQTLAAQLIDLTGSSTLLLLNDSMDVEELIANERHPVRVAG